MALHPADQGLGCGGEVEVWFSKLIRTGRKGFESIVMSVSEYLKEGIVKNVELE